MKTDKKKNSIFSQNSATKSQTIHKRNSPGQNGQTKEGQSKFKQPTRINYVVNPRKLKFLTNKKSAEDKRQLIREDKERKFKEIKQKKSEKIQRNRQFSHKTKRGQPVMKNQIEFLLKKIQTNLSKE